jgi:hypothetical protein
MYAFVFSYILIIIIIVGGGDSSNIVIKLEEIMGVFA